MEMNQSGAILGIFAPVLHDSDSIFVQSDGDEAYKLLLRKARRSRSDRASSIRSPTSHCSRAHIPQPRFESFSTTIFSLYQRRSF